MQIEGKPAKAVFDQRINERILKFMVSVEIVLTCLIISYSLKLSNRLFWKVFFKQLFTFTSSRKCPDVIFDLSFVVVE